MGCGPSRRNKHPGLNLPTDCSGATCNVYMNPGSVDQVFARREIAETLLMDFDTLQNYYNTLVKDFNPTTTLYRDYYSKSMKFFNENGANISDEQVLILYTSYSTSTIIQEYYIYSLMKFILNASMTSNMFTWYNTYVEMLYQKLMNTPLYNSNQYTAQIVAWLAANPAPTMSGFTDLKNLSNYNSLLSIVNQIKLDNKKVSGFTNYTVLKNGFINDYHLI